MMLIQLPALGIGLPEYRKQPQATASNRKQHYNYRKQPQARFYLPQASF